MASGVDALLETQLTALEAQINAYNAAFLAFATSNIQSYELDTGQDRQRVTRADLKDMQTVLNGLINQYDVICTRLNRSGGVIMRPCF